MEEQVGWSSKGLDWLTFAVTDVWMDVIVRHEVHDCWKSFSLNLAMTKKAGDLQCNDDCYSHRTGIIELFFSHPLCAVSVVRSSVHIYCWFQLTSNTMKTCMLWSVQLLYQVLYWIKFKGIFALKQHVVSICTTYGLSRTELNPMSPWSLIQQLIFFQRVRDPSKWNSNRTSSKNWLAHVKSLHWTAPRDYPSRNTEGRIAN